MRRVACDGRGIVGVEIIVEPVAVPVPGLAIPVQVPDVQVAIGVAVLHRVPSLPLPLEYSQGCIEFVIEIT